jgi:ATP-dependent Clp protease ATP-binding subunit ClpA
VVIELTDPAREWLAKKGYDQKFGARPLARVIQEHIKKPLAEELLFGKLAKGGIVLVKVKKNKLSFEYPKDSKLPVKRRKGKAPALIER